MHVTLVVLASACALLAPAVARADDDVERGRELAQEASFEEALAAFDRAERGELTRDELVRSLEGRALVHQGMGATAERDRDLQALLSIAPEHAMGREMPPALRRALEAGRRRAAGAVEIEATVSETATGARVEATVRDDPAGVVRTVRVHHRVGAAPWAVHEGASLELSVPPGGQAELFVRAVGPGQVVVASHGDTEAPLRFVSSRAPPAEAPPPLALEAAAPARGADRVAALEVRDHESTEESSGSLVPWIVAGVVAALVVGATVAVLLLVPSDDTQPSIPSTPFR